MLARLEEMSTFILYQKKYILVQCPQKTFSFDIKKFYCVIYSLYDCPQH